MRGFVTGGTGFIGSRVVKRLRDRGTMVVLARSPEKAAGLGAEVVQGDLGDADAIRRGVEGCQAVFHIAADYRVGMPASEREAMFDANVRGTERVFDAAADAGARRASSPTTTRRCTWRTGSRRSAPLRAPRS